MLSSLSYSQEIEFHVMLLNVGGVLVKAISWPPKQMLSWVMPESHSQKDLHSLGSSSRPTMQLKEKPKSVIPLGCRFLPSARAGLETSFLSSGLQFLLNGRSYHNSLSNELQDKVLC
jgi:hypothetical protein